MPAHDIAEILASGARAVSLEPSGGSKTGRPSGPVLFSGPVMAVNLYALVAALWFVRV